MISALPGDGEREEEKRETETLREEGELERVKVRERERDRKISCVYMERAPPSALLHDCYWPIVRL